MGEGERGSLKKNVNFFLLSQPNPLLHHDNQKPEIAQNLKKHSYIRQNS
jgi:hypothetical protein